MFNQVDLTQSDPASIALAKCYALARARAKLVREQQQAQRDGTPLAGEPSRRADAEPSKQQPDSPQ